MGHVLTLTVAATVAAFALTGCGGADAPTAPSPAPAVLLAVTGPATVELTDGRLGDATTAGPDAPVLELSRGGRLDVTALDDPARRDGIAAGATCADRDLSPATASLPAVTTATLCLLNGERADRGLPALTANAKLATAATTYAQEMVDGSFFSHTGRDGSTMIERIARVSYVPRNAAWTLGENLAWGTGALATPSAIMRAWMNSPGHRANILHTSYREIGVGVVIGNPSKTNGAGATYVTEFGKVERVGRRRASARARAASARLRRD